MVFWYWFYFVISIVTAKVTFSKDDVKDFVNKTKEKIDELFFKRF